MATIDFQALVNGDVSLAMVVLECNTCGTPYAMTKTLNRNFRASHQGFYCPSGHSNYYPQQTAEEQARDELAQVRAKLASARSEAEWAQRNYQAEKRSHTATKGKLTKTLNRVNAGVCIHCNRHFKQLDRHMQNKHHEPRKTGPWPEDERR